MNYLNIPQQQQQEMNTRRKQERLSVKGRMKLSQRMMKVFSGSPGNTCSSQLRSLWKSIVLLTREERNCNMELIFFCCLQRDEKGKKKKDKQIFTWSGKCLNRANFHFLGLFIHVISSATSSQEKLIIWRWFWFLFFVFFITFPNLPTWNLWESPEGGLYTQKLLVSEIFMPGFWQTRCT